MTTPVVTGEIPEGSRHTLHHDLSPDAPETESYADGEGAFGYVHTYETGSRLDGPGVRGTLFVSGCPLRCQYCHNPDTWHLKDGTRVALERIVARLGDFAPALRAMKGGLTISGGEPLVQAAFTRRIFAAAKSMGLHTALDTSGFLGTRATDEYLKNVDLVLLHQVVGPGHVSPCDPARGGADLAVRRAPCGDGQTGVGPVRARAGADR